MEVVDAYKPLGIIAVTLIIAGLSIIPTKWPAGKDKSFSQHVAKNNSSIFYYISLFSITLPLLLLFFLKWFIPSFSLSALFSSFIICSSLTQFICTLIPEYTAVKAKYHRFLAGISAAALIPALSLILISGSISSLQKMLVVFCLIIMVAIAALVIENKGEHKNFLLLQSFYFAAFFTPILIITYLH